MAPTKVTRPIKSRRNREHLDAAPPQFFEGDARDLRFLPLDQVDLILTSPPYWKRRDYGHRDQLGQERTPDAYVESLLAVMAGWVDLLASHGSVFLNIGDTYCKGFLVGVTAMVETAVQEAGWHLANKILWVKRTGRPEPRNYRLANRHEVILHLTRTKRAPSLFLDMHALALELGSMANPGDVWELHGARSRSEHLAPFPPDLARRVILLACPERVCTACRKPHRRRLCPGTKLDPNRPQAVRAMQLFEKHGLSDDHLRAIRAVGISDAGLGKMQNGAGRNAESVRELAAEAKAALGGYFREFTFAPKVHVGWQRCSCGAATAPGTVLDPFMGSGTTLVAAAKLKRNAYGVDLVIPAELKRSH